MSPVFCRLRIWGSGVRISSGAPINADNSCVLRSHVLPLSFVNENGRDTMSRNRRAESRKIPEVSSLVVRGATAFGTRGSQVQILPLRPAFLTTEAVTGNDTGDETHRHDRPRPRRCLDATMVKST